MCVPYSREGDKRLMYALGKHIEEIRKRGVIQENIEKDFTGVNAEGF